MSKTIEEVMAMPMTDRIDYIADELYIYRTEETDVHIRESVDNMIGRIGALVDHKIRPSLEEHESFLETYKMNILGEID